MKKQFCVIGLILLFTGCNLVSTMCTMKLVQSNSVKVEQRLDKPEDIVITNTSSDIVKLTEARHSEKFWTLKEVDTLGLIPIEDLGVKEQVKIREFINDTMNENLYTKCVAIEYVVDEELNGHCYHFVFNDKRYVCIYYDIEQNKTLLLYDTILNDQLIENWEYI